MHIHFFARAASSTASHTHGSLDRSLGRATRQFLVMSLVATLAACSSAPIRQAPPTPQPAPEAGQPAPAASSAPPITAPQPVAPPKAPPVRAASSTATDALVLASSNATAAGDTRGAITHLERAIRLEGRNAALWASLSTAYLRDGQPLLARQYANRALALAGNRGDWKRAAWLAIAELEDYAGNTSAAEQIRRQYASGSG